MAFEVQNPDAPTATANAYLSVADFKSYCDDRGYDYSAKTDAEIEQALVQAADYVDSAFSYAGYKWDNDQSTEVPRADVYDAQGYALDGFPRAFLNASAEYAKIVALDGKSLMPNSQDNTQAGTVIYDRRKVGEVEKEFRYSEGKGFQWPRWPLPDRFMRQSGLLANNRRTLSRG